VFPPEDAKRLQEIVRQTVTAPNWPRESEL